MTPEIKKQTPERCPHERESRKKAMFCTILRCFCTNTAKRTALLRSLFCKKLSTSSLMLNSLHFGVQKVNVHILYCCVRFSTKNLYLSTKYIQNFGT